MKHLWMVIAILCLIAGVHRTYIVGFNESFYFFIFVIVSLLMFGIRNYLDKKKKK